MMLNKMKMSTKEARQVFLEYLKKKKITEPAKKTKHEK